jgi:aldose 1-epimerase
LRKCHSPLEKVLDASCFPLVPYVNRIRGGRFTFRGREVMLNGFGGWGGEARMSDPAWPYEIRLSSREAKFFQLYSTSEGGIFVAEPVTHANAALNAPEGEWAEFGMRILDNGEEIGLDMRLEVIPK